MEAEAHAHAARSTAMHAAARMMQRGGRRGRDRRRGKETDEGGEGETSDSRVSQRLGFLRALPAFALPSTPAWGGARAAMDRVRPRCGWPRTLRWPAPRGKRGTTAPFGPSGNRDVITMAGAHFWWLQRFQRLSPGEPSTFEDSGAERVALAFLIVRAAPRRAAPWRGCMIRRGEIGKRASALGPERRRTRQRRGCG